MPCRNTGNVVAALDEFAHEDRSAASRNTIENNTDSATYMIVIADRKKSEDGDKPVDATKEDRPEKKFIGFATNYSKIRIELCSSRWVIETGYSKVEECRVKTRTTDLAARMLCFYYSMVLFNEWIIARALLSDGSGVQNVMTMLVFK